MKTMELEGKKVPSFLYGTAWKEDRTRPLVEKALEVGFRGIDTANQRKHYYEAAVGEALENVYKKGFVKREGLFLQTKFTYQAGQDHRLPYDPKADLTTQVNQSFESSLDHLKTDYVDSYVLHGPSVRRGLADADWEVWETMEGLYKEEKTKFLGVSNVNYDQLDELFEKAAVTPHFVQNRCFARTLWDKEVRELCAEKGAVYQGFSLLTANVSELKEAKVQKMAEKYESTVPQLVFRFALQVGIQPLTGTTDPEHMKEDLEIFDFKISEEDVSRLEMIGG